MRRLRPALLLLAALALGAGAYTWRARADTSRVGVEMYQELDGDGYELEPDIVHQPIFEDLLPKTATAEARSAKTQPAKAQPAKAESAKTRPAKAESAKPAPQVPARPRPEQAAPVRNAAEATPPAPETVPAVPPKTDAGRPAEEKRAPAVAPVAPPAETERPAAPTPVAPPASVPESAPPSEAAAPATPRLQRLADTSRGTRPNPFGDKVHILLIGTDAERLGEGRADTLLLLTLDPKARTLTTLHVPRDTRLQIFDRGIDKVNHAYAFGGAWLTSRTLERFFGFPFQHYVEVSLGGFRAAVDAIGGVDVDVPFAFSLDGQDFAPGPAHLDGDAALAYVRMRKDDPRGDLGRGDRQQQVILALLDKLGRATPSEARALMDRVAPYVRLDLSPSEIVALREKHAYALERQRSETLGGVNRKLGGIWYYLPPDAERRRLHLALR